MIVQRYKYIMNRKQSIFSRARLTPIQKQKRITNHNRTQWQWNLSRKTWLHAWKIHRNLSIEVYTTNFTFYILFIYIIFSLSTNIVTITIIIHIHTCIISNNCMKIHWNRKVTILIRIWDLESKKQGRNDRMRSY